MRKTKRRRVSSSRHDWQIIETIFFMGLLIIGVFIALGAFLLNKQSEIAKSNVSPLVKSQYVKITPSITPTPTIPPGYCLKVPVIYYHHIEPMAEADKAGHGSLTVDNAIFEQQLKYLNENGYTAISATALVNALRNKTSLPVKPIVVTIDDGYRDNYDFAYPLARKYNIILNLMIPTGLIDNPGYLSWENLKEMTDSGLVYAYNHTWSHFSLPRGDAVKEEMEIMTAKSQLEQHLGLSGEIFSYPYGSVSNMTVTILKKNGFSGAFTTIPSFYQCDSIIYSLHRNRIGNSPLWIYGL